MNMNMNVIEQVVNANRRKPVLQIEVKTINESNIGKSVISLKGTTDVVQKLIEDDEFNLDLIGIKK